MAGYGVTSLAVCTRAALRWAIGRAWDLWPTTIVELAPRRPGRLGRASLGVDVAMPSKDAAHQIAQVGKAGLPQKATRVRRAAAHFAIADDCVIARQLRKPARQLAEGNEGGALDAPGLPLVRLAYIYEGKRLAAAAGLVELRRCDLVHAVSQAAG